MMSACRISQVRDERAVVLELLDALKSVTESKNEMLFYCMKRGSYIPVRSLSVLLTRTDFMMLKHAGWHIQSLSRFQTDACAHCTATAIRFAGMDQPAEA